MNWNRTSDGQVPKNGLLLVTSGISWRREDMVLVDEGDVEMARTPILKCAGQAILVYWRVNPDLPPRLRTEAGGAWLQFPSNKPLLEMFEYWIAFENPITDDGLPEHHSASPYVPNLQTMEVAKANIHYKPTDPRFLEA